METGKRSRSSLFLIEQIIVIAVFAFCAAVCVYIMAASYTMSANAVDVRYALLAAENAAEGHKAFAGDLEAVAAMLGGWATPDGQNVSVLMDADWNAIYPAVYGVDSADIAFSLYVNQEIHENGVAFAVVTVVRRRDRDTLVQLRTAVRQGGAAR